MAIENIEVNDKIKYIVICSFQPKHLTKTKNIPSSLDASIIFSQRIIKNRICTHAKVTSRSIVINEVVGD